MSERRAVSMGCNWRPNSPRMNEPCHWQHVLQRTNNDPRLTLMSFPFLQWVYTFCESESQHRYNNPACFRFLKAPSLLYMIDLPDLILGIKHFLIHHLILLNMEICGCTPFEQVWTEYNKRLNFTYLSGLSISVWTCQEVMKYRESNNIKEAHSY